MDCPKLLRTLVMGDKPKLLAQVSCLLAKKGCYLPVVDGPCIGRLLDTVVRSYSTMLAHRGTGYLKHSSLAVPAPTSVPYTL